MAKTVSEASEKFDDILTLTDDILESPDQWEVVELLGELDTALKHCRDLRWHTDPVVRAVMAETLAVLGLVSY